MENKIYTKKTRKLRQNTQKIANFLRYYGKIHSKLPNFRVKSEKNLHLPEKFTLTASAASATIIRYEWVRDRYRDFFSRPNVFETDTETFFLDQNFRDRDRYSQKIEKSLDTEKSRDEMSHSDARVCQSIQGFARV